MRKLVKKLLSPRPNDVQQLLLDATKLPRFTEHRFQFRNFQLEVTDFLSVAWQIKEFFEDGRMNFKAKSKQPVIYDCGSNVGISILYYKELYPEARIVAFEPDPKVGKCLKQNIVSNGVKGVEVVEKAVWTDNDGVSFGSEGADGGSVFYEGNKIHLPSVRLKELLQKETHIDLLKMDIEGAEVKVIMDCADELHKVDHLFIEYHSWIGSEQELDKLLAVLTKNGFRYYIHSIGEILKQPFVTQNFQNGMDIQLDIHAVRR